MQEVIAHIDDVRLRLNDRVNNGLTVIQLESDRWQRAAPQDERFEAIRAAIVRIHQAVETVSDELDRITERLRQP